MCSPPETVLFWLVCFLATDKEGIIQGLDHFLMQLRFRVQVIHAGYQLVEPMAQQQFAASRLCGIAIRAFTSYGAENPTDFIHSG